MEAVRVMWEDAAVARSFQIDSNEAIPPELAPASDCSSSTYQSEYSQFKSSLDSCTCNEELQKDEDLTEWVPESVELHPARRVSFADVEVRSYPIIPGIHPECTVGPPLSIDWQPFKVSTYSIDEFETRRCSNRKNAAELRLGWWNRRCLLRRLGFSDDDMKEVETSSQRSKKHREITYARMNLSRLEEIQQSVMRKLGRALYPKVKLQTRY